MYLKYEPELLHDSAHFQQGFFFVIHDADPLAQMAMSRRR